MVPALSTTDGNPSTADFHTETYDDDSLGSESFENSEFSGDDSGGTNSEDSSKSSSMNDADQNDKTFENLAKRETAFVRMWRTIVISAMVFTGALLTTGTYLVLKNQQRSQSTQKVRDPFFVQCNTSISHTHVQYIQHAESASRELIQRFSALRSHMLAMSLEITGAARQKGGTSFPFVKMPLFEVAAHQMRERSGLEIVTFTPVVEEHQKEAWINFTESNFQEWYSESIAYHSTTMGSLGNLQVRQYDVNGTVSRTFWYFRGESLGDAYEVDNGGPYLPTWLTSPPPFSPRFVNLDTLQIPYVNRMLPLLNQTRDILIAESSTGLAASIGTSVSQEDHRSYHDQFIFNQADVSFSPHSAIIQPVWDRLYDQNGRAKLAGSLSGIIAWDFYAAGLFPEGTAGVYVVLKNSCGQTFTYLLNGNRVCRNYRCRCVTVRFFSHTIYRLSFWEMATFMMIPTTLRESKNPC